MQSALRNLQLSGPYMLAVIAVAGLFLTHYRIAMIFVVMAALYLGGRLLALGRRGVASARRDLEVTSCLSCAGLPSRLCCAWLPSVPGW